MDEDSEGDRDDCPPKYSHDELWEIRKRREALRACVKAPSIGTIFPWKGPSFFNADSLVATILEADLNVPALPQAASAVDQHRPDKRMPLPILCKTVAGDGTVSCGPLPEQTLRLDELLGQGYDSPSFVYRCTVEPGNYVVVVKLLTDQNDKVPANTHIPQEVYSNQVDWQLPGLGVTAQQDICNEADRFKDLQSLQGTYVPYSYGFYEFVLPDGYSVPAHVMEYVPTCDVRRYFREACMPHPRAVDEFLSALTRAYIELHRCGVAHFDPGVRNLCLIPADEWRLQFVLLDFTTALSIPYSISQGLCWSVAERSFLYQLYQELDDTIAVQWLATETGRRLSKLSLMTPEELSTHDPLPL